VKRRGRICYSPLPIPSTEDFIRLFLRHALACIVGVTRQLISITQPALEIILQMIKRARPSTLVLRRPRQSLQQRRRSLQMLLPERSALVCVLQLATGTTGPGGVERVDAGRLLVHGDGTGVVWPEPTDDAARALRG